MSEMYVLCLMYIYNWSCIWCPCFNSLKYIVIECSLLTTTHVFQGSRPVDGGGEGKGTWESRGQLQRTHSLSRTRHVNVIFIQPFFIYLGNGVKHLFCKRTLIAAQWQTSPVTGLHSDKWVSWNTSLFCLSLVQVSSTRKLVVTGTAFMRLTATSSSKIAGGCSKSFQNCSLWGSEALWQTWAKLGTRALAEPQRPARITAQIPHHSTEMQTVLCAQPLWMLRLHTVKRR